jgi:hypothetical protein
MNTIRTFAKDMMTPVALLAMLVAGTVSPAVPASALAQVDTEEGEQWTNDGEDGAALPEMVVEATNEVRQKIEKGSFSFELDAAAVDSFFTAMDVDALDVSPVSGLQPHLNNLETLNSDQPPHLWIQELARTPVARFYPADPEGHKVKTWSLAVTDYRGAPFKTYYGKGNPPESLVWDGLSDGGDILEVGYPYSYVFSLTDKGTNEYNYAGVSFRVPALDYRQDGDRVLELAGGELFSRQESELSHAGENWLTRVADEIRRHPYSPVRVVLTAENQDTAQERTEVVAKYLAESMILPLEQIETETIVRSDLRVEMDGSVAIIIEHVED